MHFQKDGNVLLSSANIYDLLMAVLGLKKLM